MSGPVSLVYGDELMKHRLSDQHPLQPIRVKLAVDLIRSTGLIEHAHLLPPRRATIAELELAHSPEYVDLVRKLSDPAQRGRVPIELVEAAGFGSADNPISDELHEGTSLVVGATLIGAEAVDGGAAMHAFSPSGGLHHAHRDRAFCFVHAIADDVVAGIDEPQPVAVAEHVRRARHLIAKQPAVGHDPVISRGEPRHETCLHAAGDGGSDGIERGHTAFAGKR